VLEQVQLNVQLENCGVLKRFIVYISRIACGKKDTLVQGQCRTTYDASRRREYEQTANSAF